MSFPLRYNKRVVFKFLSYAVTTVKTRFVKSRIYDLPFFQGTRHMESTVRILKRSMQNVARPHNRRAPEFTCNTYSCMYICVCIFIHTHTCAHTRYSIARLYRILYRCVREFIRLTCTGRSLNEFALLILSELVRSYPRVYRGRSPSLSLHLFCDRSLLIVVHRDAGVPRI